MKYLDLLWKLFFWNIVYFVGLIVFLAIFVGEPRIILILASLIGLSLGTLTGLIKFQKGQRIKSLSNKILRSPQRLR